MHGPVFCTLFDSHYLARGLAMYRSLLRHCRGAHLYIFAFDDVCRDALAAMRLPSVTVVSLQELEDPALLAIKPHRTRVEYCWTCTPSVIRYVLDLGKHDECTYLDADLLFFGDPSPLLAELAPRSVLITSHRYTPRFDQTATSGRYNVQFMTFRSDPPGRQVLDWWRAACLEACELKPEEGKCGDQKYLDDWLERFPGAVHVLEHLGGGVGPWNVQQYRFARAGGALTGTEIRSRRRFPVVFYHYHGLARFRHEFSAWGLRLFSTRPRLRLSSYPLRRDVRRLIYAPYLDALEAARRDLADHSVVVDPIGNRSNERRLESFLARLFGTLSEKPR